MATIYQFLLKQQNSADKGEMGSGGGNVKKVGKTSQSLLGSYFGGEKGGVEANRKMRAINPLLNKMTGGWWEKGTRLGRAGMGLIKTNPKTGNISLSGVSVAIIISFITQQIIRFQQKQQVEAKRVNRNNFKKLEVGGDDAISGAYTVSTNLFDGKITYNQNK